MVGKDVRVWLPSLSDGLALRMDGTLRGQAWHSGKCSDRWVCSAGEGR